MDFNVRAMSLAECVDSSACVDVREFAGISIEFRVGISFSIRLPENLADFAALPEPERLLLALSGWTRVFRYPDLQGDAIHVIAAVQTGGEDLEFYRIDFWQPRSSRRGRPKPSVEIKSGAVMTYRECAAWLVELALKLARDRDRAQQHLKLARPRLLQPKPLRLAWVGPEIVDSAAMPERLQALGQVFGAEILYVPGHRTYRDVVVRLNSALPFDSVIICAGFAPHITADAVPLPILPELIHVCHSTARVDLEEQIQTWIEVASAEIQKRAGLRTDDAEEIILNIMLRGMVSHSKIGQFNHCQKATVLTGIRARHLDASLAEQILDANSDEFQRTKQSAALFLWKDHHDGRQYFLNPTQIDRIRALLALPSASRLFS